MKDKSGSPVGAWLSIVVIVILTILSQIDRNSVSLLVDPISKTFGINDFEISLLQGPAFAVFFLLGSLIVGWMIDKYSKRWLIYFGVTIWSCATIAGGLAESFTVLLIARCFVGLGESVLQPAGWNIIGKLFPANKLATAIGILTAGAQAGVACSFILVGYLASKENLFFDLGSSFINGLETWQFVFIVTGVPGIFLALLIFLVPRERKAKTDSVIHPLGGFMLYIRRNRVFLLCHFFGFGFLSIMVHGAAAWAPTYLTRVHGVDIKQVGFLVGIMVIPLGVGGAIFAGWLVDRYFKKGKHNAHLLHFACRSIIIAAIGALGFIFDTNLIFTIACFGLIQFIQPFSGVAGASLQISVPDKYKGRISGLFIMFYSALGLIVGPVFVAFISQRFTGDDLGMAMAINYALFGSLAAITLYLGRRHAALSFKRYGILN